MSTGDSQEASGALALGAGGYVSLALSGLGFLAFWDAESTKFVHGEEFFALYAFAMPLVLWTLALLAGGINLLRHRRFRNPMAWLPLPVPVPFLAWLIARMFF